jgi:hypothetical protein
LHSGTALLVLEDIQKSESMEELRESIRKDIERREELKCRELKRTEQ